MQLGLWPIMPMMNGENVDESKVLGVANWDHVHADWVLHDLDQELRDQGTSCLSMGFVSNFSFGNCNTHTRLLLSLPKPSQ